MLGSPRFLGNPIVNLPCSWTPAESYASRLFFDATMLPPSFRRRRLRRRRSFRGSITRLFHSLPTLRATISDDYARLASGWWLAFAGWDCLPWGSFERFLAPIPSPFPRLAWRDENRTSVYRLVYRLLTTKVGKGDQNRRGNVHRVSPKSAFSKKRPFGKDKANIVSCEVAG